MKDETTDRVGESQDEKSNEEKNETRLHNNAEGAQPSAQGVSGDDQLEADEQENEFVNVGLRRWEESRAQFTGVDSSDSSVKKAAIPLDVDEIIDLIFSQRWRTASGSEEGNFPRPVPLPQMVDILVDLWEAEGLDV